MQGGGRCRPSALNLTTPTHLPTPDTCLLTTPYNGAHQAHGGGLTSAEDAERLNDAVAHTPSGQAVLVVEDDQGIGKMLVALLAAEGYQPTLVTDGGAALKAIPELQPSLITLDLSLPTVDGIEVLERLDDRRRPPGAGRRHLSLHRPADGRASGTRRGRTDQAVRDRHVAQLHQFGAWRGLIGAQYSDGPRLQQRRVVRSWRGAED